MRFSHLSLLLATATSALPLPGFLMRPPREDSFYDAPSNLDSLQNGEIFSQRQVSPDLELQLSLAEVHQIAYKTSDVYGEDSHGIATVFKPLIPAQDHKLFSYQFWEDADQLNCNPSYTLIKGILAPDAFTGILDSWAAIELALSHGIYVVVPDHEGPRSAFIEGYIQGQTALDGIQAAINFFTLGQDTPVVLYGYSGGASATAWMCNLQESYAPHLNIVGAAYGGTPVDLRVTVDWLDHPDRGLSGFIVGAFTGILNAYQKENETIWPHIDQSFKDRILKMKEPDQCVLTEVLEFGHTEYNTQFDIDFWTYPPIVEVLNRETLFKNATGTYSVPKFPRYMFHAEGDEVIPVTAAEKYIKEQCAAGADIQWVPWKGDDHVAVEYLGIPDAFQFILQAFDGTTPRVQCGYASNDILTWASTNLLDVLGQVFADFLSIVNGLTTPLGTISFDPNEQPDVANHI